MKTKLLLYCSRAKPYLIKGSAKPMHSNDATNPFNFYWHCWNKKSSSFGGFNGKIVAECECEVEEIVYEGVYENPISIFKACRTKTLDCYDLNEKSCLNINNNELEHYLMPDLDENNDDKYFLNKVGYARHISNIKVFDKPNNLESCVYFKNTHEPKMSINRSHYEVLHKAPKNAMRVIFNKEEYILLSVSPTEMCNILNGKQTIIVRKKVLKGML